MNTDIVMNNTSTPTGNNNNYVAVKVTRGEEMRRFQFNGKSFQEIKDAIALLFSIPANDFTLQYQDDEKDRVTLSSDAELNEAIKLHKYVLRFYVVNKPAPIPAAATFPIPSPQGFPLFPPHHAPPSPVNVVADGEVGSPATPPHHPHPHGGYHHGHHHHGHPYGHHGGMMRGGRHGFPGGGYPHHGPHGHGPHHEHHHKNKRHLDKEEREAWKLENKRFKKQRKCEKESSSSSSSSEEDVQKVQRKEMKQLFKATKQQIKKNWAATKDANPAQWPENRKLMIAEIKAAKKLIHEQAHNLTATTLVPVGQNVTASNVATEMQA